MKKNYLMLISIVAILTTILMFNSCKKEAPNPCEGVTCYNGGFCINGSCSCPQGYSGPACETQVTPTKIRISKIEITRFPATDGGAGWDLTSGPDIYPIITKGTTVIWDSPNYAENADPSYNYEFTLSPSIDLTSPTDQYTISLYDYDDIDDDDWMGGIYFTPYSSTNGFPSTMTIDAGGEVAFIFHVTYEW